jgi:hypothetical protein
VLVFPGHRELNLVHKARRGQLNRMPVAEDGLDDLRREEADSQDAGEVGPANTGLGSEFRHRLPAISHDHRVVPVSLGENSAQAVVGFVPGAATGAVDQQPGFHAGPLEPRGNGEGDGRLAFVA